MADLYFKFAAKEMAQKLGHNKALVDHIIPKDFGVGCRRPTVRPSVIPFGASNY